jgi:micrococcal nuclease
LEGAFLIQVHETANRPGRVRRFCFRSIPLLLILIFASVPAASGERQFAKVKWVDDGDTILLVDGRRVRYIGINAPETENLKYGSRGEPFGYEALRYNLFLVKDQRIVLEFDREKTDQYGRTLAYVHLPGGPFVNLQMVEEGLAYFVFRKPNNRYDPAFLEAQRKAMKAGRGIWSNWRKSDQKWIGNRRSRRFHDPDCPFGQQVSRRNRVDFDTRWEAFWMGYAPAKRCGPDD